MVTIYCFANGPAFGGGDVHAVALADNGKCVAGHVCSSECYIPNDLGVTSNWKHDVYDAEFGKGNWTAEFVRVADIASHAGLQAALKLNRQLHDAQKESVP